MPEELNPQAQALNARLDSAAPEVLAMLSALGRRLYFPAGGILAQSAEGLVLVIHQLSNALQRPVPRQRHAAARRILVGS